RRPPPVRRPSARGAVVAVGRVAKLVRVHAARRRWQCVIVERHTVARSVAARRRESRRQQSPLAPQRLVRVERAKDVRRGARGRGCRWSRVGVFWGRGGRRDERRRRRRRRGGGGRCGGGGGNGGGGRRRHRGDHRLSG